MSHPDSSWTAGQIALNLHGEVMGDSETVVTRFTSCDQAQAGDLTFAETSDFFEKALKGEASAILIPRSLGSRQSQKTLIVVDNARIAFAKVLPWFFREPDYPAGIHPTACVGPDCQIAADAHIGPNCVLEEGVTIGSRTVLISGIHVGRKSIIGQDGRLFPGVSIYPETVLGDRVRIHSNSVIGSDGYGYVFDKDHHRKVLQVGKVLIEDDVEIGAGVTIDRGALGSTIIGQGTKIDNLVQIAHNVVIGKHCLIVAQTGIAGSTRLGNYVTLAGQVGLAGHLKIGNRVTVAAQSGVMHDIPDGEKWLGSPAMQDRKMKRIWLAMQRIPDLLQQFNRFINKK